MFTLQRWWRALRARRTWRELRNAEHEAERTVARMNEIIDECAQLCEMMRLDNQGPEEFLPDSTLKHLGVPTADDLNKQIERS